jgi:predicted MFS family arabinose efflux permease
MAFLLFCIYCVASPWSPDANALMLLQILGGAAVAIPNVLLFANAGRELSSAEQVLAMGIFQSVYSIGMTVGPIISGHIVDMPGGGYTAMFYTLGGVSALGAIGSFIFYKNPRGK